MSPIYDKLNVNLLNTLVNPVLLARHAAEYSFVCLLYMGLFLLPLLAIAAVNSAWSPRRLSLTVLAIVAPLTLIDVVRSVGFGQAGIMPLLPNNILSKAGIGPNTIERFNLLNPDESPVLPRAFWIACTVLSLLGAALLIATLAEHGGTILRSGRNLAAHDLPVSFFC